MQVMWIVYGAKIWETFVIMHISPNYVKHNMQKEVDFNSRILWETWNYNKRMILNPEETIEITNYEWQKVKTKFQIALSGKPTC